MKLQIFYLFIDIQAIFNEHGYLLCKTKDSSRVDAFGFFDDFVEEAAGDDEKEVLTTSGRGEAPLSRFEATSNNNEFSQKYGKLKKVSLPVIIKLLWHQNILIRKIDKISGSSAQTDKQKSLN